MALAQHYSAFHLLLRQPLRLFYRYLQLQDFRNFRQVKRAFGVLVRASDIWSYAERCIGCFQTSKVHSTKELVDVGFDSSS